MEAISVEEVQFFIPSYQQWYDLLQIKLNVGKDGDLVQSIWAGRVVKMKFGAEDVPLTTRATFPVGGIELRAKERVAYLASLSHAGRSIPNLKVPAGVAAQMLLALSIVIWPLHRDRLGWNPRRLPR